MAYVHTKDWGTPLNRAERSRSRGKNHRECRGAWLDALAQLKKSITLCFKCSARWSPKANGYVAAQPAPGWHYCIAECDGCRDMAAKCTFYTPQER